MSSPPPEVRLEAFRRWSQLRQPQADSGAWQWTFVGPQSESGISNCAGGLCSGRVTALVIDNSDSNTVYIGGAAGGVWKTTDGGVTWLPLTDFAPSLSIGALAIDPSDPKTVYAGTGEQNDALYEYPGAGILKTTDGGATWSLLAGSVFGGETIGALAVSRANPKLVLAAAKFGLYQSQDGGLTWRRTLPTDVPADAVVFDPVNPATVYAAVGGRTASAYSGVYISTDSGASWQTRNGLSRTLPNAQAGRIALAVSPSPVSLYAGVSAVNGDSLDLFKSTDGGLNWDKQASPSYCIPYVSIETAQCNYGNVIAVDPANPSLVLAGGIYLVVAGTNARQPVHVDQHAIAFTADGSRVYVGNDGGLWSGTITGMSIAWQDRNAGLGLAQFYPGVSTDPSNPKIAYGGTQDNNVLMYSGRQQWKSVSVGDGGATAIDRHGNVYLTLAGGSAMAQPVWKSTAGGPFVPASAGIDTGRKPFPPYLAIDPQVDTTIYYTGLNQLYQSTDGAAHWSTIPAGGDSAFPNLSTVAVAPRDSNTVYAGSFSGNVWVSRNATMGANSTWKDATIGLPRKPVNHISIDAAGTAYVTLGGSNSGHIYRSSDAGQIWTNITGNLPDLSVNDLVIDPDISDTLYAATDLGVYWTDTGGQVWSVLGPGLPNSPVVSLQMIPANRTLRAATHGRGVWDLPMPTNAAPLPLIASAAISGTTLIVTGGRFTGVSVVYWNGKPLSTTFNSATQLTAALRNLETTPDAWNEVQVFTPGPGGGMSTVQYSKFGAFPAIVPGAIVNAASLAPAYGLAPGSIATAFGGNLASEPAKAPSGRLPVALGNTLLTILDSNITLPFSARMFFVDQNQINFQVPWSIRTGDTAVFRPVVNGAAGPAVSARILPFAPGIFVMDSAGQGAVTDAISNRVASAAAPVKRGDVIVIYCTGLGAVTNSPADGSPALADPLSETVITPVVVIGGVEAPKVLFSGLTPGSVGLNQINVRVPGNAPTGSAVSLMISDGNGNYSNTVFIAVQ